MRPQNIRFSRAQVAIQGNLLRYNPDDALDLHRLPADGMTGNERIACGWFKQAGEHRNRRGFAGAVGAKQAEHLAFLDCKGNVLDGQIVAVVFLEMGDFDDR